MTIIGWYSHTGWCPVIVVVTPALGFCLLILVVCKSYTWVQSVTMYFIGHIYFMWLLFVFACAILLLNLS
jgi:hypothetical protein